MVKSEGEQRKSDGVVAPLITGRNPVGGKGPDFDHAREAGKRKGMAGTARSNYPDRISPIDNVRRLQRKLWAAAKQSPERHFHALFDRVCRGDVLVEAWKRVRANRGAAGVDRQSLEQVQGYGVDRMLPSGPCRRVLAESDIGTLGIALTEYHRAPVRRRRSGRRGGCSRRRRWASPYHSQCSSYGPGVTPNFLQSVQSHPKTRVDMRFVGDCRGPGSVWRCRFVCWLLR